MVQNVQVQMFEVYPLKVLAFKEYRDQSSKESAHLLSEAFKSYS